MIFEQFINQLRSFKSTWDQFNIDCGIINLDYNNIFKPLNIFLEKRGYIIVHSYDHETLKIEYILYFKGEIVTGDLGDEFSNPYWNLILYCFKQIKN